jgi:hypothetical protein
MLNVKINEICKNTMNITESNFIMVIFILIFSIFEVVLKSFNKTILLK